MRIDHMVTQMSGIARQCMGAVLEDAVRGSRIGQVRGDVALSDLDGAVEHILCMNEYDCVDQFEFAQHDGARQTVEVGAGHESMLGWGHRRKELMRHMRREQAPSFVTPGAGYSGAR